jgi:hypothetical protein
LQELFTAHAREHEQSAAHAILLRKEEAYAAWRCRSVGARTVTYPMGSRACGASFSWCEREAMVFIIVRS